MMDRQWRDPAAAHSVEAVQVGAYLATVAWNESVGLRVPRDSQGKFWKPMEADDPTFWDEFVTCDTDQMLDQMIAYKTCHFGDDQRRILTCGILDGKIRVEWLAPAGPDVDSLWELRMYGLIRMGKRAEAVQLMRETRHLSHRDAAREVDHMARQLGMPPLG